MVQSASSSFNFFANLVSDKFSSRSDFGITTVEVEDGGEVTTIRRSQEQILNIIKYATMEVLVCAEEIIRKYRRSVLEYAIYHREHGKHDTFKQYIHLVACHCLTHTNFLAPNVDYPQVSFYHDEQPFRLDALTGIVDDREVEEEGI
ncbi:hypothetical protein VOLCADRAFT_94953 [Volvox carteri f. nagariensis]|uniref:Uncharacterized protein n=1 Tax=Volvox carteri f. nagariensis TaxID=3068 RepID=D8U677_VOLCA|nr:uncharacterized protein VOLCADRAFT_94953 [Volvox carteri f. nagariensis]XP_002959785.1 uncharacterized protein VOLCADRAFT_101307 [Volvox carteri f. nagariensis]EFJ39150.1 hypothetical protein VOLCADRAFT_101307 [Volvox carteri f. nagariensis]EFJ44892.1 hypothetical protein VOLCADRAFT_94953 [Volvox carteri f. nagariensis]|eukprot:XP_002954175.1 hypothetical protein VOLCADRAFT_94953 [Volvox carteri f. nagariensis]